MRNFTRDSVPELQFRRDTTKKESKRKQKIKKRIFYGKKCKKGFTKKGRREKQVLETFWYLKKFELPDPYVKDIYVFDIKERKILEKDEISEKDKMRYRILHGPYKRTVGGEPTEMGIFYVGMKHARWEKFTKGFILTDKTKYYRGWQKDAEITYYDNDRKKIKEVLPYKYKSLQGSYYLFSETGQVLVHGKYQDDQKIGKWVDYFAENGRRKKETIYPKDLYKGEQFAPYVLNEWDDVGNPVIKDGKPFDPTKSRIRNAPPKNTRPKPSPKPKAKPTDGKPTQSDIPEKTSVDKKDIKKSENSQTEDIKNKPQEIPKLNDANNTNPKTDSLSTAPRKPTKEEIKRRMEQRLK
jgi:hypothetical protein